MTDRGTATLLLPVGLLLMITLAAVSIDLSHARTAQTELQRRADAAANDAATAGLDPDALRADGIYRLDPTRARAAASRASRVTPTGGLDDIGVQAAVIDPHTVRVALVAEVDLVFSPALPGGPERVRIHATATATADIR